MRVKSFLVLYKVLGSVLALTILASCAQKNNLTGGLSSSSTNGSSSVPGTTLASCSFNGHVIPDSGTVTGFLTSSVAFGQTCSSQTRTCSNGTLSGSYGFSSCTVAAALSCTFNNAVVASGGTVQGYTSSSVAAGQTCTTETVSCLNGVLSPSSAFATCTVSSNPAPTPTPAPCSFNGTTIASGSSVTAYLASTVAYGQTCTSQSRSCSSGTLSGTYTFSSCTVAAPASCTFNGKTVASGSDVTPSPYTTATVPYGQTCQTETVACSNGTLSPSGAFATCTVSAAPTPTPTPSPTPVSTGSGPTVTILASNPTLWITAPANSANSANPNGTNFTSRIGWSSVGATSCTASGAWSGTQSVNGTYETANFYGTGAATHTYTLTCTNSSGSTTASTTVTTYTDQSSIPATCGDSTGHTWVYHNGIIAWPNDFTNSADIRDYTDTTGDPFTLPYDLAFTHTASGNPWWLPAADGYAVDIPGCNYINFTLKPTTDLSGWNVLFHYVGDIATGVPNVDLGTSSTTSYGPIPVSGKWATYKMPLSVFFPASSGVPSQIYKFGLLTNGGPNEWYIDEVSFSAQ